MEPLEYRIQECEALIAHSGFPPCFLKGGRMHCRVVPIHTIIRKIQPSVLCLFLYTPGKWERNIAGLCLFSFLKDFTVVCFDG